MIQRLQLRPPVGQKTGNQMKMSQCTGINLLTMTVAEDVVEVVAVAVVVVAEVVENRVRVTGLANVVNRTSQADLNASNVNWTNLAVAVAEVAEKHAKVIGFVSVGSQISQAGTNASSANWISLEAEAEMMVVVSVSEDHQENQGIVIGFVQIVTVELITSKTKPSVLNVTNHVRRDLGVMKSDPLESQNPATGLARQTDVLL